MDGDEDMDGMEKIDGMESDEGEVRAGMKRKFRYTPARERTIRRMKALKKIE